MGPIYKPKELYKELSISRQTVDRMIARKEFPEAKPLSPGRKGWPKRWVDEWRLLGRDVWREKHAAGETLPQKEKIQ